MIWIGLALALASIVILTAVTISNGNKLAESLKSNKLLNDKLNKVTSEFASVRVKHGQTWESFLPLMKTFEIELGPKENATFLGQPIDLIYFNEHEIVFAEVKTGNSRLSSKQRHIRDLIKNRKVRWAEVNDSSKFVLPGIGPNEQVDMLKIIPHRKP